MAAWVDASAAAEFGTRRAAKLLESLAQQASSAVDGRARDQLEAWMTRWGTVLLARRSELLPAVVCCLTCVRYG